MISSFSNYEDIVSNFSWPSCRDFNIADVCCDKWANKDNSRVALIEVDGQGGSKEITYKELQEKSNRLANSLAAKGVVSGDRIGIYLPQCSETAVSHFACYKLGAIAVPLFSLFGPDAVFHRMNDCSMRVVITDARGGENLLPIINDLNSIKIIYSIEPCKSDISSIDFHKDISLFDEHFSAKKTSADDPAMIIYTSGTTGSSKGAVLSHKVLIGHIPGVQISHDGFPQTGDVMWTPADWAWIGGLLDVLLPSLYFGVPVIARRMLKFNAEEAFSLIESFGVRNIFLPPTALKIMRQEKSPKNKWDLNVRSIASGGESLGEELLDWGRKIFDVTINEFYGQTECNIVVSSSAQMGVHKPGHIGKSVPGHKVAVIDNKGNILKSGELGSIAIKSPDPVMFIGYWNNPKATKEKFIGDWLVTGDLGVQDEDGFFKFVGRDDDVITSAGYRIGPAPIENCLLKHPSVRLAAVVGKPDALRTEIVKAFIVLAEGYEPTEELSEELKSHVKKRLAAHEYPREITFIDELPQTATGKIIRGKLKRM
ncbi:acyl-CoA synthetase [Halomonas sp. AOP25-F1-15]|uniref:acyl-CoA synthetase n=1 Tax=Halomonas sp. AOP25-F1-15 TaxID=3457709 RepID=UPI004034E7C6